MPALVTYYAAPASATGQDVIETQVPGHPALLERVVSRAIELGARAAEPGEFSYRACLSGKLSVLEAQGVAAGISAASEAQWRGAAVMRDGTLGELARGHVDALAHWLALVEAGIDFTDQEDVTPAKPGELARALAPLAERVEELRRRCRPWAHAASLPRVVLAGAPNAGKSTLFNALLGRARAVASETPGSTRDVLEEPVRLPTPSGEVEALLVDTAGLHDAVDWLDRLAQAAARRSLERADVVAWVRDAHAPPEQDAAWRRLLPQHASVIEVLSKCDLDDQAPDRGTNPLRVSAHTGAGLAELRSGLARALGARPAASSEALALQPRHEASLAAAAQALNAAAAQVKAQGDAPALAQAELLADELRAALHAMAELGGAVSTEDLLGRVFSAFCVGK